MQTPKCQVGYFGYHDNQKYKDLCQAETNLKKGKEGYWLYQSSEEDILQKSQKDSSFMQQYVLGIK